jgi:RNA polymerase sigma-70 factor (ECF subfamily)
LEDSDIIRRVKNGNIEAFSVLVEKYHRNLLNFVFRLLRDDDIVEDVGQEVFLSVYKSLKDFDETRGTPFSAWLFITARNRCISELRKRNGKEKVPIENCDLRSKERSPEDILIDNEAEKALNASLQQLPEPYRSTILDSIQGDSLDEIAIRENISLGTVKSRLFRARKRMKLLLGEYYGG